MKVGRELEGPREAEDQIEDEGEVVNRGGLKEKSWTQSEGMMRCMDGVEEIGL